MRVKHLTPPASLNIQKMTDYPDARMFKTKHKTGVWAYMGQLYSESGVKLPHDPEFLAKKGYTLTKEMAGILTQRKEPENKTCPQCSFNRLAVADRFCKNCGTQQPTAQVVLQDEALFKLLRSLDSDNPFALLTELQPRDARAATPEDFATQRDFAKIIAKEVAASVFPGQVPGEAASRANPKLEVNPYRDVTFSIGG